MTATDQLTTLRGGTTAGSPDVGWVRRLLSCVLQHRRDAALAFGAAIVGGLLQVAVPLIAREIVDKVIIARTSPLWPWLTLLAVVALAAFGCSYVRRYRGGRVSLSVQWDLRNRMHDHLQQMDLTTLGTMPTGQLVARANSDSTLVQALLGFFPIVSGNALLMVLSLVVMFILSPLLALVAMVVAPALLIVSYRMRTKVFPASWDGQQREGDVAQIVDEDVTGVRVVKAFGQEHRELQRIVQASERLYGSRMRAVRLQARYQPLMEAVPVLGQVAVLAVGGAMALHGALSIGTFLAFSTYVAAFVAPARQLAGILTIGQQARAGVERIFQLLETEPTITDPADGASLGVLSGELSWQDVTFGYAEPGHPQGEPAEHRVLDGFSLHVSPGERVALVGASGSGKSTAALMLSRFHDPQRGTVLVDGVDVRTVRLPDLRSQIAYAFEDSFLFSDTVGANIAYGRPGASVDEVAEAARVACADEFISALPQGYDTPIGERGMTLSGGQRQRIALARAVLADPAVLVLDDATSAVDAGTEERILGGLRQVLTERTTLLVAHRVSTLRLADRVVLVEQGRTTETGTHEELMQRSRRYRELVSGLDVEPTGRVDGRIETLAQLTAQGRTDAAWTRQAATPEPTGNVRPLNAPGLGGGLGGGGGGWRLALAPTPDLLARVDSLPRVRDFPTVDVGVESRQDRDFSLRRLLREFRRPLLLALVFVVLDAVAGLAGPALVKVGVDDGVVAGSGHVLMIATLIFLGATLIAAVNGAAETFVVGRVAERLMLSLRVRIWAQLQRMSLDYYEREMAGRIMTRMTTDVDSFENLVENGLLNALVAAVTFVGVGAALLVLDLPLGLATLSVVIPLVFATIAFRRRAASLYTVARERIAIVNADFQESLSGIRESQAFAHEELTAQRFQRLGRDYLESRVAAQRLVATYFPFVQLLSAVADVVVLGLGATLIEHGHLTTGALIAFLLYINMFFSPIQQLSQVFDAWQQTRVSVDRIAELMRLETLTPQAERPIEPSRLDGEVEVAGVHFTYPVVELTRTRRGPQDAHVPVAPMSAAPPEALRGIDIRVATGQTIALVGETGAGKSTVMKMLARFYDPGSGRVSVDGMDLRQLDRDAFHRQLGYVPQEMFLFTGTVRDNVAYGRPEASDAAVEAAARSVGAHDFISALPGGYHHPISERGRSLSAGQRQLIALARAELVDPAILLLDEATANLDLVTEAQVVSAMHRVSGQRTTVLIAHRLPTARAADRIVVLHRGQVAESGSHQELLAVGGRYAAMWQAFESAGEK
ncbi:ABC transporter ATP-binding protein [Leekyejoonella antrihumi]|uniref:ABC transporter ATP-binding protein n=1 Tax=Leekyejoonella antrihumi TaxID=1660198 RepID=A0A563E8G2_9MICO|nr:ABC transporter ATP-binding protein [Leekyejoonella antrihumi]TWP38599.1 ABC transporter ATP-binding protein [Leekyejoonella antrihumi]